jgi:hypothetical protein
MKGLEIPAALDRDFLIYLVADFRLTFAQLDRRHVLDRVAHRQVQYRSLDSEGDCRRFGHRRATPVGQEGLQLPDGSNCRWRGPERKLRPCRHASSLLARV